jgi:hypothetical protein
VGDTTLPARLGVLFFCYLFHTPGSCPGLTGVEGAGSIPRAVGVALVDYGIELLAFRAEPRQFVAQADDAAGDKQRWRRQLRSSGKRRQRAGQHLLAVSRSLLHDRGRARRGKPMRDELRAQDRQTEQSHVNHYGLIEIKRFSVTFPWEMCGSGPLRRTQASEVDCRRGACVTVGVRRESERRVKGQG